MPIRAGEMDRRVQFYRRTLTGAVMSPFAAHGGPIWAAWREDRPRDEDYNGLLLNLRTGALRVRDSRYVRGLSAGDRVLLDGVFFEVRSTGVAGYGELRIELGQYPDERTWEAAMSQGGENVTFVRPNNDATVTTYNVRARVTGYKWEEIAGGIGQGDRRVIVLASDVVTAGITPPFRKNKDAFMVRGVRMSIQTVDDSTYRNAGILNAYEFRVVGA